MKRKPEVAWKQLTVRIPPDVHRAVKVRAAEEGLSVAVLVEGLIRQELVLSVNKHLHRKAGSTESVRDFIERADRRKT